MLAIEYGPAGTIVMSGRLDAAQSPAAQSFLDRVEGTVTLDCSRLEWIAAAHLSKANNTPFLAQLALSVALDCQVSEIAVADQDDGLAWRVV